MIIKPTNPKIYVPQDKSCVLNLDARDVRGGKIYDRSGKGNHGAITGASLKRKNYGLPSLSFDGVDDYVDCGNDESLNITDAITIEAWVKPKGTGTKMIIGKARSTYAYLTYHMSGKLDVQPNGGTHYAADTTLPLNEWSFVSWTYKQGEGIKFYYNGNPDGTGAFSGTFDTGNNLEIGAFLTGTAYPFNGSIDEVRIYNRALSAAEISKHFNELRHIYGI